MSTRADPDAIWKAKVRWNNSLALYERAKRILERDAEELRALTEQESKMSTPSIEDPQTPIRDMSLKKHYCDCGGLLCHCASATSTRADSPDGSV